MSLKHNLFISLLVTFTLLSSSTQIPVPVVAEEQEREASKITLGTPINISGPNPVMGYPNLFQDSTGRIWLFYIGGDVVFIASTDNGKTWTGPTDIPSTGGLDSPSVIEDDGAVNVFCGGHGNVYRFNSTDGGAHWSTPETINGLIHYVYRPQVTKGSDGTYYLVYTDTSAIYFSKSKDKGKTWEFEKTVGNPPNCTGWGEPFLLMDSKATLWIWWSNIDHFIYRTSSDNGESWSSQYHYPAVSNPPNGFANGTILETKGGALMMTWMSYPADISYAVSEDHGQTWDNRHVLMQTSDRDSSPSVLISKDDTLWLAWMPCDVNNYCEIYMASAKVYDAGISAIEMSTLTPEDGFIENFTVQVKNSGSQKLTNIRFDLSDTVGGLVDNWYISGTLPAAYTMEGAASFKGYIYLFNETTIQMLDLGNGYMTKAVDLPAKVRFPMITVLNDRIYYIGGKDISGPTPHLVGTVWEIEPTWQAFKQLASMPSARCGAAIAVVDGVIYVIGGKGNESTVESYDPSTNLWTARAPTLAPRVNVSAVAVGNEIYVFSGLGASASTSEFYNISNDTWTYTTPPPYKVSSYFTENVAGMAYIMGGIDETSNTRTETSLFQLSTKKWSSGPPTLLGSGYVNQAKVLHNGTIMMFSNVQDIQGIDVAGSTLLETRTIDIPERSTSNITFFWNTSGQLGRHLIRFELDPDGLIPELARADNVVELDVLVQKWTPTNLTVKTDQSTYERLEDAIINLTNSKGRIDTNIRVFSPKNTKLIDRTIRPGLNGKWNMTMNIGPAYQLGNYSVVVSYINTSVKTRFEVVNEPPEISSPPDMTYIAGETGNYINWTCYDLNPASYNITRNGTYMASGPWDGSSRNISVDGLPPGSYLYELTLADLPENVVNDMVFVNVTVKPPPPSPPWINISNPKNQATVQGTVIIDGTAGDLDDHVVSVHVIIDDVNSYNATGTTNWTYEWDTTTVPNGLHNVSAAVTDMDDATTFRNVYLTVNNRVNLAPSISIMHPLDGALVNGIVSINGTASDSDGNISMISIRIDDGNWTDIGKVSPWELKWNTRSIENGSHAVLARAIDNEGAKVYYMVNVTVFNAQNRPPIINITSPKGGSTLGMTIIIKGIASDPDLDNFTVQIRIGDDPWANLSGKKDWNFTWNTKVSHNGNYTITAKAIDEHGASSEACVTVQVMNKGKPHQGFFIDEPTAKTVATGTALGGAVALGTAGAVITLSDVGSFAIFKGLFLAGMAKRKKKKALNDKLMRSIRVEIVKNPGIRLKDVMHGLKGQYPSKKVLYTIYELIRNDQMFMVRRNWSGKVTKVWRANNAGEIGDEDLVLDEDRLLDLTLPRSRVGNFTLYIYPTAAIAPRSQERLLKKQGTKVLEYVSENPGASPKEIAKALDITEMGVAHHLNEIEGHTKLGP